MRHLRHIHRDQLLKADFLSEFVLVTIGVLVIIIAMFVFLPAAR